jgi:formylglycine-generating enzyme required for sulfatase activity
MVGQRHTTILLARLYADQMIATQENAGLLPENIPELMLSYLNQLNRPVEAAKRRDNLAVHRDAEAVAWMCLQQTYRPTPAAQDTVLNALAEINPDETKERLNYLKDSLRLVQTVEPEDKISMVLDPLAEYLAGLYLVQQYRDDTEKWQKLLKEADNKPDAPKAIQGFLLSLRDCCEVKQKEANIPSFVIEELTKKAGLDSEEIHTAQQKRRVRMLINDLSAPQLEYRARAAADLGQIGKAAKAAIPRLRKALEDESEAAKVRREAAKALKQMEEEIPMLIAEINDGVESIRLVEPPTTEKIDLGNGVILELVRIPGGEFFMGAPAEEKKSEDSERPQHLVTVAPFLTGKYPVTQAQWQAVAALPMVECELNPEPSYFKDSSSSPPYQGGGRGGRPVECVSWYDGVEFCKRLSQHTGGDFRLPSEAEWEYACRAGTTTPFHFGETIITDLANYDDSSTYGSGVRGMNRRETTPVGMFQVANAFGLYDMHGNVWEWCADPWYENYQGAPTDGRVWEKDNDNQNQERLLRGGSCGSSPGRCRSACRNSNYRRDKHFNNIGFRVVCAAGWTP